MFVSPGATGNSIASPSTSSVENNTWTKIAVKESNEAVNYDIGQAVDRSNVLTDFEKYNYITNTWVPEKSYLLPFSEHNKNGRIVKRYLARDHLEKYEWIAFSHIKRGLFCKHCVLFANSGGRNNCFYKIWLLEQ